MSSDYYASWVELHKFEGDDGRWWRTENEVPIEGPYTEEELDKILWDAALAGDALPAAP